MINHKAVLLVSGGLDSITLAYWLSQHRVTLVPVFIDYGQHSVATEFDSVKRLLPENCQSAIVSVNLRDVYQRCQSRILHEPDLWKDAVRDEDLYLPFRNQILLTVGAAIALSFGCDIVYSGFIQTNLAAEDCSARFLEQLARLTLSYGGIRLLFPFKDMSKSDVARLGLKLGAPIAETYSCLMRSSVPCGVCPNCIDRAVAFASLDATNAKF